MSEPIAPLMPHARGMCWLHTLHEASEEQVLAEALPGFDHPFATPEGIAIWHGLEYMAQAVAAWAGWQARRRGEPPAIGFLLGTRRYGFEQPHIALDRPLFIRVRREFFSDNGLGQFRCELEQDGQGIASASLSVFEPPDAEAFLQGTPNP